MFICVWVCSHHLLLLYWQWVEFFKLSGLENITRAYTDIVVSSKWVICILGWTLPLTWYHFRAKWRKFVRQWLECEIKNKKTAIKWKNSDVSGSIFQRACQKQHILVWIWAPLYMRSTHSSKDWYLTVTSIMYWDKWQREYSCWCLYQLRKGWLILLIVCM